LILTKLNEKGTLGITAL